MANRALLKKAKTAKELKLYQPSSEEFKEIIFEEIRLDVPILEVGSSSIGKSFSLREFMEKCGVTGEFLFVGTEKSEFIEGIPNLNKAAETSAQKFTYLKPYWFPDKDAIRARLKNGREQLAKLGPDGYKELADMYAKAKTNYDVLTTLKNELGKIRRDETALNNAKKTGVELSKFLYSDAMAYISMLQGFGNFWLILDEIDKVEKQDKDKYAPLLHIVRERELKGWKLSGLRDYPEYDIKFVQTIDERFERLNKALEDPKVDITDTRVIAISNDLQVMEEESPALYRRFVKTIVDRTLYDENAFSAATSSMSEEKRQKLLNTDPSLSYQSKRNEFHSCLSVKEIPGKDKMVKDLMAEIEPEKTGAPLNELNLQWTLGFLPDLLFPGIDTSKQTAGKELFIPNLFIRNWNETEDPFKTLLYKIITDNFAIEYWIPLMECIDNMISFQKMVDTTAGTLAEKAQQMLAEGGLLPDTFNDPNKAGIDQVLSRYNKMLLNIEDGLKNLGPKAQEELRAKGFKTEGDLSGITGSILITAQEEIQLGGLLIEASMIGDKKTVLTDKLLSGIPFIQARLISSSPYISHTYSKDMMNYMNDTAIKIVKRMGKDKKLKPEQLQEEAKKLFENVNVDKDYLLMYGCGINEAEVEEVKNMKLGPDPGKAHLLNKIFERRPVIIYDPLAGKLTEEQKIKYYQNLAPYRMIEKEVFSNLPKIMEMIMIEANKMNNVNNTIMTPGLEKDLSEYCQKYPHNMKTLSEAPVVKDFKKANIYDFIQKECDDAIASGTATEIDVVNSF